MSQSYHPLIDPFYKAQRPITSKDSTSVSGSSQKYYNIPVSSVSSNTSTSFRSSSTRPSSSSYPTNVSSEMTPQLSQKKAMQRLMLAYLKIDPMNCIIDPQGYKGGLYLGNIDAAENIALLKQHNIGAVLTVAARTGLTYHKHQIHTHEVIRADDVESFDLSAHFSKIIEFIEENLIKTNVLVHCFAGISRSATAVIAYLMKCRGLSLNQALLFCKAKRKVTNPNPGFVRQLLRFESTVMKIEQAGKSREEQQRVELGRSYEKQGYYKEKEGKKLSKQDDYYDQNKQRYDPFFKESSLSKSDLNNKSLKDQKKDNQQRYNYQKYEIVNSMKNDTKPSYSQNNLDNLNKTFSSEISVKIPESSSRDKQKALDEEYLFYLKKTRNSDDFYSNKSNISEIDSNFSQKNNLKGRSASNKPSSENILKDKKSNYNESLRQTNQTRGYSATSGRTNQFSSNDQQNHTFSDQTSQNLIGISSRNYSTGLNNKSDYKNELDKSYLARSAAFNQNKSYSAIADSMNSTQFSYVPQNFRTTLEDKNVNKQMKDSKQTRNHRITDNLFDRTQQSFSALPRGYTSLLSSPFTVQLQTNITGYQPSVQSQSMTSVITKYNNLQNSLGGSRYEQLYPSNHAASQLRASISQNFYSPYSTTNFSSSSYRQGSSQFQNSPYQSIKRGIY